MWLIIIGLIFGASILALVIWLQKRGMVVKWYEWLIGAIGLLLLLFTIQNFVASFAEHEEHAAWTFLWLLGTPAIILLGLAFFLPFWRHFKKAKE